MHDDIDEIEQCPTASGDPFNVVRPCSLGFHCLEHLLGQSAHVGIRGAGRDDEEVRSVAQGPQVEHQHVDGFVLVERVHRETQVTVRRNAYPAYPGFVDVWRQLSAGVGSSI